MSYRQTFPKRASTRGLPVGFLEPATAWMAILGLFLCTFGGIFVGAGRILNLVFPVAALGVGGLLYFRYPILYLGFTWWMWLITPFLRRLIDIRIGYTDPSPILVAPYLVTAITLITVFQHLSKVDRQERLAFGLPLAGLFYGYLIGLINHSAPVTVTRELLDWLTPVTFGFHCLANWRSFPNYYQNLQRTFAWGVLIVGFYGVYQYVVAPDWDILWLIESEQINANGYFGQAPGPYTIRVFSTMQSAEPFAAFMGSALVMLLNYQGILKIPAFIAGFLAFLFSLVRSAWLGWLAGLVTFVGYLKSKNQMRLIVTIGILAFMVIPLASMEPFSAVIGDRVQSLSNVQADGSAQVRQEFFQMSIFNALTNFVGDGIGAGLVDSGILAMFFNLGIIGTVCYVGGLLPLTIKLFQEFESDSLLFFPIARAMIVTCLVRLPVNGTSIVGVGGLILWSFLGLGLAARRYYKHQERTLRLNESLL
jgi:hypothetical protein